MGKHRFARFGRPSKFAAGALLPFAMQQFCVRPSSLVSKAHPDEVKQLMRQNANQFLRLAGEFQIQHHSAFADECSGVDRLAISALGVESAAAGA